MRMLALTVLIFPWVSPFPAFAQKTGWMDVSDCPVKHPGAWQKIKDTAEQAQLRKELAGAGKIVFSSNRDGNWEIYVCNADGSGQKNLTNHPAWDIYPRWTPDGKQIIFFSDRDSKVKIAKIYNQLMEPITPIGPWTFTKYGSSYNGSRAEELDVMPQCGIYIMDADGSNVKQLVKDARRANLSRDGKFLSFESKGITITRNLATSEEFDAVQRYFGGSWWPELSPDGKRMLVATVGDTRGSGMQPPPPILMATIFDLKADRRPAGTYHNIATGSMTLCPRWRPDGKGFVAVQGSRELHLQHFDLNETPDENGWLQGKTIGLAAPADRFIHAFPAFGPNGKHIAFSLSPIHFLVRDQIAPLGYRSWKDGNQIVWQELCIGRAQAGKANVWIQLTDGGYANRDADWLLPP